MIENGCLRKICWERGTKSETKAKFKYCSKRVSFLLPLETYSVSKYGEFANPQALGLENLILSEREECAEIFPQ